MLRPIMKGSRVEARSGNRQAIITVRPASIIVRESGAMLTTTSSPLYVRHLATKEERPFTGPRAMDDHAIARVIQMS